MFGSKCFGPYLGYGSSRAAFWRLQEGSGGAEEALERRCATGSSRAARAGFVAAGRWRQRAVSRQGRQLDAVGRPQSRPPLSAGWPRMRALRQATAWSRKFADRTTTPPNHRHGVQRSAAGARPLDRAAGRRRSCQATIGPACGRETIRVLLLNHDLKPWRGKKVVRSSAR